MNMMPGFAPKPGDLTRHDPSMMPWSFRLEQPKSNVATILNAANEPIGTITGNSHATLNEMIRLIEDAFRERDELLDEIRCYADRERNLNQGRR